MPTAPPRACARCGKPAPKNQPCACRPAYEGSQHPGSTTRWRTTRATQLHDHPMCQHPDCHRLAVEVDHIVPLAEGGDRYNFANLMSLCLPHHQQKTVQDSLRGKTRPR